jgi:VTC domain
MSEFGNILRHEYKYELSPLQHQVLKRKIELLLKLDPFAGPRGGYHIRNLYFDDFRNTSLTEKWEGVYHRKKYRIRIYDFSDSKIKFERKTKMGEYILKESAGLSRNQADLLIAGDCGFLANSTNSLLRTAYVESRQNLLQPVVIVQYYREAFYDPVSHVRITFDTDLCVGLGSTSIFDSTIPTMPVLCEPNVIMELKFSGVFPHYIQGILSNDIQPRMALGKFALCRAQQMCLFGCSIGGLPYARCSTTVQKGEYDS